MELKPGYKQTEVGVIPDDWDVCSLTDLSLKITDGDHLTPKRELSGYYLLSARNVLNGRIDVRDVDYVGHAEYQRMKQRCGPEAGDILISCSGSIGRVAVVPEGLECVLVRSAALAKIDKNLANGTFVQFWLQGRNAQSQISGSVNQGAQPNLFLNQIERLKCPKPPLAEQLAIANVLSDLDQLLSDLGQLITKKLQVKQATMQKLLTGKRRLPGFEGEWEVKRLGEIATIDPENLGSNTQPHYRFNYISLEDVDQGALLNWSEHEFSSSPSRARRRLRSNDVLVSTVRPNLKSHLLFGQDNGEWVCSTGFALLRCNSELADPSYVFFHLFGAFINKQIEGLLTGSNYPAISSRDVRSLEIPVPALSEQKEIARTLTSMADEIISLTQRLEKSRLLKQGMMQQLLTGKIRLT